jgi:hypothetical protein
LSQIAGIDSRSDTVVSGLNAVEHASVLTGAAEKREHTLLRSLNSRHLGARRSACLSALLRVGGAVRAVAKGLGVNSGGGEVFQFDHYIGFAGCGKLDLEITNRGVVNILKSIKSATLGATDFIDLRKEICEQAKSQ